MSIQAIKISIQANLQMSEMKSQLNVRFIENEFFHFNKYLINTKILLFQLLLNFFEFFHFNKYLINTKILLFQLLLKFFEFFHSKFIDLVLNLFNTFHFRNVELQHVFNATFEGNNR